MQAVIYVRNDKNIPIYEQYNKCAEFVKRQGYSISGKVLDFDGKNFHEAVNKVIAEHNICALIVYSKETAFDNYNDYLFYRIYIEKLGKKLILSR